MPNAAQHPPATAESPSHADVLSRISVLIVDDHAMVREAFSALMERTEDIRVVGLAADGHEGAKMAAQLKPDIVSLDLTMPRFNGVEAIPLFRRAHPTIRILVVTAHKEDPYIGHALEAGIDGFICKCATAEALLSAIRAVARGRKVFSSAVHKRLLQFESSSENGLLHRKPTACLSHRENEVLQLIAEGNANKQVAAHLEISIKTVEKHRQHIMEKLHIHDTAGLTRHAIVADLIETSPV